MYSGDKFTRLSLQLDLYTGIDSIAVVFRLNEILKDHVEVLYTQKDVMEFYSSKVS